MLKIVNIYKQPEYVRSPLLAKNLRSHLHYIEYTVYRERDSEAKKSFFLCEARSKREMKRNQCTDSNNNKQK